MYSLTEISALPANIQKLPAKKRRQWVHVYNGAYTRATGSAVQKETSAFAQANGVVLRNKEADEHDDAAPQASIRVQPFAAASTPTPTSLTERAALAAQQASGGIAAPTFAAAMPGVVVNIGAANKDYGDTYAAEPAREEQPSAYVPYTVQQHQLDQETVNYTPISGQAGQACANCQWMLTPDGCINVEGVISPTGWCQLWRAEEGEDADEGMPVTITNVDEMVQAMQAEHTEATPAAPAAMPAAAPAPTRIQRLIAMNHAAKTKTNPLPDSAYAYIDPQGGGHFPVHDEKHARLAVQMLSKSPYGPKAKAKVHAAAKKFGIKVSNKEITGVGLIDNLYASLFGVKDAPDADAARFQLTWTTKEDGSEQLRWFGTWTNVFKDRSGTIIPTYSHKEYVEYVDREGAYPELLYWHIIGTEFGRADWMEYDGMLTHAAGYVYDDPQSIDFAIRLSEQPDLGMSHGTIYVEDELSGDITQHRTFELSVLPNENANNTGTVWLTLKGNEGTRGDETMAFSAKKKASLKELSGISDEQVELLEQQTEAFRQSLVARNIAWKSDDEIADDPTAVVSMSTLSEAVMTLAQVTKEGFDQLRAGLSEAKTTADTALVAANKSRDDIIADAVRPASAANAQLARSGEPYVATKAADNVTGEQNGLTTQEREGDAAWSKQFMGLVFGDEPAPAQ